MIDWSSYVMSIIMVTKSFNVHYYERYVNLADSAGGASQRGWLYVMAAPQ
jgi:hypothetical protein